MARIDRFREFVSEPFNEDYLRERMGRGWKLVAVEWEHELEEEGEKVSRLREEVPYGLRVAADCLHLEENPFERQVLELMLDLIVTDQSLSQVAEELNGQGFRTRPGLNWTQVAVFNMLPRLVEAAPQIRRTSPSLAR
jgi:recombinase